MRCFCSFKTTVILLKYVGCFKLQTSAPYPIKLALNNLYLTLSFHRLLTGKPIFRALQQILLEARIESSKTELSQALKRTALEKGFAISDNQGEGNCMFFALSEQLDLIKGIQMSHDELRRTVVQHLRENPRLVSTL